ncbi:MAG TPA: HAD family phosphatase [Candidatus Bathyarchaeia archaeon]|nr:HAD family phosphatase [Candidatus Bathyarchaeia archaeon]
MFEAVIFDWDGTLADTRRVVVASFQKALSDVHCKISDEFIERRIGIGVKEIFREILRVSKTRFDETLITSLVGKKIQVEIDLSSKVKLFEGAMELLEFLRGKVKLALASMSNRDVIDYMLNAMNLQRFFDVVLTVDEVDNAKPDPEIFLKCALKIGSRPEKCVVVEDSIFGVKAAKAAKMGCIAVLTGVYNREELKKANPDLIVNSLKERDEILDFILQ